MTSIHHTSVKKDLFDANDRHYIPPLINLPTASRPSQLHRRLLGENSDYVRNQGSYPYCTAMALANVIDYLVLQRQAVAATNSTTDTRPPARSMAEERCSARMLYEMAKAFDEYPDEDPSSSSGSSLRGALKGFYHNGVYRRPHDERTEKDELSAKVWTHDISMAKKSRETILGTYARVAQRILDYQSAIAQIGIIYVSASIHCGWEAAAINAHAGTIPFEASTPKLGNHAFAIIGYTETGFLVLNSAGEDWGKWKDDQDLDCQPNDHGYWPGVALWSYADWSRNILDAWVMRLGVAVSASQFRRMRADSLGDDRLSGFNGQGVTRLLIHGHYLHSMDGMLVKHGVFSNDLDSFAQTAQLLQQTQPAQASGKTKRKYTDLLIFIESGLDSLDLMTRRCALWAGQCMEEEAQKDPHFRPYPISVIWRKDVLQITEDLLEARVRRIEARSGGFADARAHWLDAYAREFLQPIWRTFEGEAERCFDLDPEAARGEPWQALRLLLEGASSGEAPMGIHFIVHGSGLPWFLALARQLATADNPEAIEGLGTATERRRRLRSVTLLAPIATTEQIKMMLADLWGSGRGGRRSSTSPLAILAQPAAADANEDLAGYRGSFLELARRCFPIDGSLPTSLHPNSLAGHEEGAGLLRDDPATEGLLQLIEPDGLEGLTHPTLMADSRVMERVWRQIRARACP